MTVYLIFFWIFALAAILLQLPLSRTARLTVFLLSYFVLVVFVGLRWETGNDWAEYYVYYQHLQHLRDNPVNNTFEVGYRLFSFVTKSARLSYAGFLLIYSAVYLALIFASFWHEDNAISGWLALQLYAPFILGLMGTSRQVMSLAICMFSVRYLLRNKWLPFLLCIALATAFHVSALTFLVAWPIARLRLTARKVVGTMVVLVILSVFNVGKLASNYAGNLLAKGNASEVAAKFVLEQESSSAEFNNAAGDLTAWNKMVRLSTLALFAAMYPLFSAEPDRLYFKFYIVGFCMLFLLSGAVFVLAERAALYFTIFQIHLLALPTRRLKSAALRNCYCIALLGLSLVRLFTGVYMVQPRVFVPYKGVLINSDVKRDLGWFRNDL